VANIYCVFNQLVALIAELHDDDVRIWFLWKARFSGVDRRL